MTPDAPRGAPSKPNSPVVAALCAGQGTRLRPLTDDRPKCLVELLGQPLIGHQLAAIAATGVKHVSLITGYASGQLKGLGAQQFHNPLFAETNMIESLFCARSMFDGSTDLIIAYSDIVYEPRILTALLAAPGPIATVIDLNWRDLWNIRMDDPLSDAESLRLNADGTVREIGQKAHNISDIEGQYIGLTKISADAQRSVLQFYDNLDRAAVYAGRPFAQMFMTEFLTQLISTGFAVHSAPVEAGWLEIDTIDDLNCYEQLAAQGKLDRFWRPTLA